MTALLLAVELADGLVRAAAFDEFGRIAACGEQPIETQRPADGHAVLRMDGVWHAVGGAVHACLAGDPALGMRVVGLGFAATTALVLECDGAAPFANGADTFGPTDRRALAEAAEINAGGDRWLDHRGGAVPPESNLARLAWLKRHDPAAWARLRTVRDLCDELARRATGVEAHAQASLTTQFPYLPQEVPPWREGLLAALDLAELPGLGALSGIAVPPGGMHGTLLPDVAAFFGLPPGIPVAAGLVDAHAGLLGTIGRGVAGRAENTAVLVGGAATALLALSPEERLIPGIEGPFRDALFPGLFLYQAMQPCAGTALDAVLARHGIGGHEAVAAEILAALDAEGAGFAARRHVVPDFLGNRAPLNDATLGALATGIRAEGGHRAGLEAYYATARGLALQLRQVIGHFNANGFAISRVALGGAQSGNPLLERLYRDALGGLVVSSAAQPVLLGVAMAAAVAAGIHPSLAIAVDRMAPPQIRLAPDPFWRRAHDAAFGIYLRLCAARDAAAFDADALAGLAR